MKHLVECSFCQKKVYKLAAPSRGLCANCYYREKRNGTPAYQNRARKPCSIEGCEGTSVGNGYCDTHYRRFRKTGDPTDDRFEKWGHIGSHPLHHTHSWLLRKGCVSQWKDFWAFVSAVGERPGSHRLHRKDKNLPFGPDNCYWKAPLLDASTKTKAEKSEWMRAYRTSRPHYFKDKELKKAFGISLEDYKAMLTSQGGGCAICGTSETGQRFNYMPVDHCHNTNKIRGILCAACNKGIGHFKDSPSLLRAAAVYVEKK